ncbi:MAG: hypothetical protein NXI24_24755 [bacterium]|nr:hypothetical protein [bacterium]
MRSFPWKHFFLIAGLTRSVCLGSLVGLLAAAGSLNAAPARVPDADAPISPADPDRNDHYDRDDWSDLERVAPYGSEKEEKYRVNALVVEEEFWEDHYSLGVLGLFRYTDYPAFRSLSVLPFYSSLRAKNDPRRSRWVLPFYYSSFDGENYFQITPLSFRRFDTNDNGFGVFGFLYIAGQSDTETSHKLLPVFTMSRDLEDESFSLGILPVFFAYSGRDEFSLIAPVAYYSAAPGRSTTASPLHFYHRSETSAGETSTIIAPGFYDHRASSSPGDSGAARTESFASLIGPLWRSRDNVNGAGDADWHLLPFYLSFERHSSSTTELDEDEIVSVRVSEGKGEYEDAPIIGESDHRTISRTRWIPPLLTYSGNSQQRRKQGDLRTDRIVSPLFYYHDHVDRQGTEIDYRTTLWFPLPLPLHYRSDDSDEGSARLYGPLYYAHDRNGELEALTAAPIFFYKPNDYLHVAPLYFQTRHDEDGHRSFSLLHYAHIQERNTPEERGVVWAGPYYRSYNQASERHYAHLAPLYFSWDTPESEFNLALPAYVRYRSANRYIHINAAGISITRERLPIPRLGRNDEKEWYFEQDVALFYNLFRLSTRVTLSATDDRSGDPENENIATLEFPEADFSGENSGVDAPGVSENVSDHDLDAGDHDRTVSRENSRNYWGVQSLYGMLAYEQADSRRHFRILPLSWFTWDTASDDRVYMVPGGFLSYKDERADEEYFALFPAFAPLYGYQRQGESFTEAYLGLAYIREHDAESETREHSILWPLVNFHSSPQRSGGRVLPLFWHRTDRSDLENEPGGEIATTVAPFYFSRTKDFVSKDSASGWSNHDRSTLRISPLFFFASNLNVSHASAAGDIGEKIGAVRRESTLILPAPGLYLRNSDRDASYSWLGLVGLFYERQADSDDSMEFSAGYLAPILFYKKDAYAHLAPLYFSLRNSEGSAATYFGPGYYYDRNGDDHETLILPGIYRSRSGEQRYTNLLLAASWETDGERGLETAGLLPVFSIRPDYGDPDRDFHFYAFPFYYGREAYDNSLSMHLLPGIFSWYVPGATESEAGDFSLFAAGLYIRRSPDYSRDNFLYLIDRVAEGDENRSYGLLLDSVNYSSEAHARSFDLVYGYLAGLSHRDDGEYDRSFKANLLWLTHESRPDYFHNSFLPVWWYDREGEDTEWAFAPLLSGGWHEGSETTRLLGGGALYYETSDTASRDYTRAVLMGVLYSDIGRSERGYRSRGSLWSYLWQYQSESESDFQKFSVLKFVYSKTRHAGKTSTRIFGIRVHES